MRIKGGYNGYKKACDEAFTTQMMNPEIRWNQENGFFVESGTIRLKHNEIRIGKAFYDLNNGSKKSEGSRKQYQGAREIILLELGEI